MTGQEHATEEAARHGIKRSPHWPAVEREHKRREPICQCCTDPDEPVQVHHIFPFHYCVALGRPDLELDHRNLISLGETEKGKPGNNCHLLVGHLDDFKSSNLAVDVDARTVFHGKLCHDLQSNPAWLYRKENKLKKLDEMSDQEKAELRRMMDAKFPVTIGHL